MSTSLKSMSRYTVALVAALVTGCASAPPTARVPQGVKLDAASQTALDKYEKAWDTFDGEAVLATFAPDGVFVDPDHPRGMKGKEIVEFVHSFKGHRFDTTKVEGQSDGSAVIHWTYFGTGPSIVAQGQTSLTFRDGMIARVKTEY